MTPERWRQVETIFEAVLAEEGEDRKAFLEASCGEDAALRREVVSLLQAHEGAGSFLSGWAGGGGGPRGAAEEVWEGRRIGAYEVVRELGRGGMGRVFLGERLDEYRARAAIKVVDVPLTRPGLLERFRRERQILADLDHPNIARLLDGGTLPGGVPYLVMEVVGGAPIDEHCDRERLSVDQRLHLFLEVCGAVQFAHQRLVVHRDLKPDNILVTPSGSPKLLDFGIAKLLDAGGGDLTATRHLPMTPRYASPEQVHGGPVTTATDVYSLGVLLYELLTGRPPHRVDGLPLAEVARRVSEEEPLRPSVAVDDGGGASAEVGAVARARRTTRRQIRRRLRGDLDNVVLTALRKDPARRYASVEQLADDVRNHLDRRPVAARPDGFFYRAGRFLQRNRLASVLATLLVVLLTGAFAGLSLQSRRIAQERDKAEEALGFLVDVFRSADPFAEGPGAGGTTPTVQEVMDRGAERIEREVRDPRVRATLFDAVGESYRGLGLYGRAEEFLGRSLDLRRRAEGSGPAVIESLSHLADLHLDRGEHERAEELLREALDSSLRLHGRRHVTTAAVLAALGRALRWQQRYEASEEALAEALEITRAIVGPADPRLAKVLSAFSILRSEQGRLEEAEALETEALDIRRRSLGPDHPDVAGSQESLAVILQSQDRLAEAFEHQEDALETMRRIVGPDHPALLRSRNNVARLLHEQGRLQEALEIFEEVYDARREALEDGHPRLVVSRNNLALVLGDLGRWERAAALYRENLTEVRARYGEEHLYGAGSLHQLGAALRELGRRAEAEAVQRRALSLFRALFREPHQLVAGPLLELSRLAYARGDLRAAGELAREALELRRRTLPPGHPRIAEAQAALGCHLEAAGRHREAEQHLEEALDALPADASRAGRWRLSVMEDLAALYATQGRAREAEDLRARLARARGSFPQPPAGEPAATSR